MDLVRTSPPGEAASHDSGAADGTANGKEHFEVLDGLRGTAAMLVVLFHIQGITVNWEGAKVFLHHAPLAVDFFFALSGFVIAYAYDDRWNRLTTGRFLALRLIRLQPMVIIGVLLGFVSYLVDPFAGTAQSASWGALLLALVMSLLVLPAWGLPNRFGDTHPLNGPCWSLFQEYIGNLAYAFVLRHLPSWSLAALAAVGAIMLTMCGLHFGSLDLGSGWDHWWAAPLRLCYPFLIGLWLYRVRGRLPRIRLGLLFLSAVLIVAIACPILPEVGGIKLNGIYEAACVIVLFPLIIVTGSHSNAGQRMNRLCKVSGRISYPLYVTHFPFLYIWMNFVANEQPTQAQSGTALVPFLVLVAWLSLIWWDEPIRARLRSWLDRKARRSDIDQSRPSHSAEIAPSPAAS
ncbi:peptidoglycan/LPS O-acetylase OafA/YrhL [Novosphingobium sp. PhB165]|uniref:acyltransferase family protein n=1 Tax=Novosphingobium sp. PhB165 TaxID=2485105 RepID=UPI0010D625A8|nr:acyltransferase [Novosphingobium sp. PhB165]TCM16450.1 peptidoglycan/LPS O-acetylase OafA/YrhL [Novosphingobium sp. PhB165]